MEITADRCNEDFTQCTKYPQFSTGNVCNDLNSTFYGKDLLKQTTPTVKCPVQAVSRHVSSLNFLNNRMDAFQGKYVFNNSLVDFTNLARLSVITGMYKTKFVAYQVRNGNRRQILCWTAVARVSNYNKRKN